MADGSKPQDATASPSFEASLEMLQQIVNELETGSIGLEESLQRFEEGIGLLRNCYALLENAEQRIELLTGRDAAGNPLTTPFDATASTERNERQPGKPTRRRTSKSTAEDTADEAAPEKGLF